MPRSATRPNVGGLRTVMQELIYLAARVVRSARQLTLRFSHHCPGFEAFRKLHAEFP